MIDKITLIGAAKLFQVHPRTITRLLCNSYRAYWSEKINENLYSVADIAEAYGMTQIELSRCIEGRDKLLKPKEAARILGISERNLRTRASNGRISKINRGRTTRYLQSKVNECKIYYAKEL